MNPRHINTDLNPCEEVNTSVSDVLRRIKKIEMFEKICWVHTDTLRRI